MVRGKEIQTDLCCLRQVPSLRWDSIFSPVEWCLWLLRGLATIGQGAWHSLN